MVHLVVMVGRLMAAVGIEDMVVLAAMANTEEQEARGDMEARVEKTAGTANEKQLLSKVFYCAVFHW